LTDPTVPFPDSALPPGQRVVLCVEYDGSPYAGWQAQPQLPGVDTVQETLEAALTSVANVPLLRTHCAGRTDAGVHALAQWVHFDAPVSRGLKAWVVGVNAQLPPAVRVVAARPVPEDFHARHSALARSYEYLIANTPTAPALLAGRALWVRQPLDETAMDRAVQALLGERDFSAFRAASCQSRTPMRFLGRARVSRHGHFVQVHLTANAFLHHMVRNIVGSLLPVGLGERPESWPGQLLEDGDRRLAGPTAGPSGLYLSRVVYPEAFGLPDADYPPFLQPPPAA
jgi:tRNA pseudouridine38-40 synthase